MKSAVRASGQTARLANAVVIALGTILLVGGCNLIQAGALFTAPATQKMPAEFNRLPGKAVLVYVWVEPEIRLAYDKVRLDLAGYLSEYLAQHVEEIDMIDYFLVESHLEGRSSFDVDPVELGREFRADMVVHVSVYRLTLRDTGMYHYYRGRMGASIQVCDLSQPDERPECIPLQDVEVTVPESGYVGAANMTWTQIKQQTFLAFTEKVGRKFHEYNQALD